MLLVDSVLMSKSFSFGGSSSSSTALKVNIGAIQQAIGKVGLGLGIERASEDAIAFNGSQALAFAFTVKVVEVTREGRIVSFNENRQGRFLAADGGGPPEPTWVGKLSSGRAVPPDMVAEVDFEGDRG